MTTIIPLYLSRSHDGLTEFPFAFLQILDNTVPSCNFYHPLCPADATTARTYTRLSQDLQRHTPHYQHIHIITSPRRCISALFRSPLISPHPATMCRITLSPTKHTKHGPHHKPHHHHTHLDPGSSVEELVRIHRNPSGTSSSHLRTRYSKVRILAPSISINSTSSSSSPAHHHHHIHPLHMNPLHHNHYDHHRHASIRLHGPGKKRVAPPPPPPPPLRNPTRPGDPVYRTQIVEPMSRPQGEHQVRESTRIALREVRPGRERGRLRRVAGYQVLGCEMPWSWDCVSSVTSGTEVDGKSRSRSLKFPPFGGMEQWM